MVKPLVYMRFRPAWTFIDGIREFGRFFCQRTFAAPDVAERATVVLQEAIENAIKYSSDSPSHELELSLGSDGHRLDISLTSTPDPRHLAALRDELRLLTEKSPEEAYLAAFERASENDDASARLGLARIRYEGKVDLSLVETPDGRITLSARGEL
jgi:hypothetical protein